ERVEQRAALLRPHAANLEELGRHRTHRASLTVVRDREAMRLIAHALQHPERRRAPRQSQRLTPPGNEDLLLALGQRDRGKPAESRGLERLARGAQLPLPSVDDDEVGERLLLLQPAREVA